MGARRLHRRQRRHAHRAGEPSHGTDGDAPIGDALSATMPAGSVMFYVGTVWHGGGANHTSERRFGVILGYVNGRHPRRALGG